VNNHRVNDKLRMQRKLQKWTRQDVADKIGASHISVVRWEKGQRPNEYYRRELCRLFGKNEEELGISASDFSISQEEDTSWQELHQLAQEQEVTFSQHFLYDPALPPLPTNVHQLIGRDSLLYRFKQRLIAKTRHTACLALSGLPGVGKTALVTALAHDKELQAYFCDGILWSSLGPTPNIRQQLGRWASLLDLAPAVADIQDLALVLHMALKERRMLLILDDVWKAEEAQAFQLGGPCCSHLITTRLPGVAYQCAWGNVERIPELNEDDGVALLTSLAPTIFVREQAKARELVFVVGGLPLALTSIGQYLRLQASKGQPRRLHDAFQNLYVVEERMRLTQSQGILERSPRLPFGQPLSLQASIAISDQYLSPQAQAALRDLAVFPAKPNTFSEEAALAVSCAQVNILDELTDAGLLESSGQDRYTMHRTIIDYARMCGISVNARKRLAEYYVQLMEREGSNYHRLEQDMQNIVVALQAAQDLDMHEILACGINVCIQLEEIRRLYHQVEQYLQGYHAGIHHLR